MMARMCAQLRMAPRILDLLMTITMQPGASPEVARHPALLRLLGHYAHSAETWPLAEKCLAQCKQKVDADESTPAALHLLKALLPHPKDVCAWPPYPSFQITSLDGNSAVYYSFV